MDDFKKPKKRPAGSLDGFVQPEAFGAKKPGGLHAFNQYYKGKPQQSAKDLFGIARIDDFRGLDGFVPNAQAPMLRPGAHNKPDEISEISQSDAADDDQHNKKERKQRRGFMHFRRKTKQPKKHANHRKFKIGLKVAGALAMVLILAGGALSLKVFLKSRGILKGDGNGAVALNKKVDPTLLKGEGDGRVNILVLGKGGPGHEAPDLTDTVLVASIDPIAKEIALVSVPRDMWVRSDNGQSKINAVYANAKYGVLNNYTLKQQTSEVKQRAEEAGVLAIEKTIINALGIPLHYYAMVDFEAFRKAVDTVGGIDINVKNQLYDPSVAWENNNNPLIAAVGMRHFDGKKALLYARSRNGSTRGDFDRTERQREVIIALKTKVLNVGTFANPLKLNQLIDAFGDHVSTDFSLNEMMRVYDIVKNVESSKIQSIGLADPPNNYVTTGTVNGLSVVRPRSGLFDYTEIQSYIRNTLRDSFLKSENAGIAILNGTGTAGLATLKSTELKSYGYNVIQVGDAPASTYTQTVLIDLTKGVKKYTRNYLEKRLKVKAINTLPDTMIEPGTADFVIILGTSEPTAN